MILNHSEIKGHDKLLGKFSHLSKICKAMPQKCCLFSASFLFKVVFFQAKGLRLRKDKLYGMGNVDVLKGVTNKIMHLIFITQRDCLRT